MNPIFVAAITALSTLSGIVITTVFQSSLNKRQLKQDLDKLTLQNEHEHHISRNNLIVEYSKDRRSRLIEDLSRLIFISDIEYFVHERDYRE